MSKDILDEIEKYSGPRICPKCGHQFPFEEFVRRYVMGFGLSKWSCQGCSESIKCDFAKLQIMWFFALVAFGIFVGVLTPYFDQFLLTIIFLIPSFGFMLLTLYYVKFEKDN